MVGWFVINKILSLEWENKNPRSMTGGAKTKVRNLLMHLRYAHRNRPVFWGLGVVCMMVDMREHGLHSGWQYTNAITIWQAN